MSDNKELMSDRNWFIVFSVALIFGIVWTFVGDSVMKVVYTTLAFMFFIHSGITMELNAHHAAHGDSHH
jgi:hypothetical protein